MAIANWTSRESEPETKRSFPAITGPLRHLTIAASSVLLDRFDRTMRKLGKRALVEDMNVLRSKGFNAHHFIELVQRLGDTDPNTGLEKLRFLAFGSPKLRYILFQIKTYVLPHTIHEKPKKLLLTEEVPLSATFWESVCNITYVETAVLHGALTDQERIALIKRFNDPDSTLLVLCIMYAINSQGVNIDKSCCRVLVVTAAVNAPLEIQAYSRVIRVSYPSYKLVWRSLLTSSFIGFPNPEGDCYPTSYYELP
jgi:Helicase conserved C-terminal domain